MDAGLSIAATPPAAAGMSHADASGGVRVFAATLLLGLVLFVNEAVLRAADVEQFRLDWQIVFRLAICGLCGLYGLAHLPLTAQHLVRFPYAWAFLFALWNFSTVPFSVSPAYCLAASGALLCMVLFAPAVLLTLGGRRAILVSVIAFSIYFILSWYFYFLVPELGRERQLLPSGELIERFGGLGHPNTVGRLAALTLVLLLVLGRERAVGWIHLAGPLILSLVSLWWTGSRTAMLAAIVAVFLLICRQRILRFPPAGFWLAPAALLATWLLATGSGLVDIPLNPLLARLSRSGEAEEIYTLTGRDEIWAFAMQRIADSPITGAGHGCARFIMTDNFFPTHHAHNLLLNVALSSGLIGGALLAVSLAALLRAGISHSRPIPDVVTVLILVCGIADFVMLGPIPDAYTMFWLLALLWRQTRESL